MLSLPLLRPPHRLAAALLLATSAAAHANLVINGDFETGDFSGWTSAGANSGVAEVTAQDADDGQFGAGFSSAFLRGITQLLATVPGETYDVSFWVRADGPNDNEFIFNWDGGGAEQVLPDINPGFATFHFQLVASGSQTEISFLSRSDDGRWSLDSVTVTGPGGTLPEPAPLALLGGALVMTRLRRR